MASNWEKGQLNVLVVNDFAFVADILPSAEDMLAKYVYENWGQDYFPLSAFAFAAQCSPS
jgi:hypothetical protein